MRKMLRIMALGVLGVNLACAVSCKSNRSSESQVLTGGDGGVSTSGWAKAIDGADRQRFQQELEKILDMTRADFAKNMLDKIGDAPDVMVIDGQKYGPMRETLRKLAADPDKRRLREILTSEGVDMSKIQNIKSLSSLFPQLVADGEVGPDTLVTTNTNLGLMSTGTKASLGAVAACIAASAFFWIPVIGPLMVTSVLGSALFTAGFAAGFLGVPAGTIGAVVSAIDDKKEEAAMISECVKTIPTCTTGYRNLNYQGDTYYFFCGKCNTPLRAWNDRISSLKIPEGMSLKACRHSANDPRFSFAENTCKTFKGNVEYVGAELNDQISYLIREP